MVGGGWKVATACSAFWYPPWSPRKTMSRKPCRRRLRAAPSSVALACSCVQVTAEQKGDKGFWDAHDKLFENQGKLEDAAQIGRDALKEFGGGAEWVCEDHVPVRHLSYRVRRNPRPPRRNLPPLPGAGSC